MSVDLAVVGSPFLDLTFEGIDEPPDPGTEAMARALHLSPGGCGMTAVAAARLGLSVTLVSPVGRDFAGELLHTMFEEEGIDWRGPDVDRTPVTAVVPLRAGPAMVTFHPPVEPRAEDVAGADPQAVVLSLGRLALRPPGTRAYVVTGFVEVAGREPGVPEELRGIDAVICNAFEAERLTGESSPEAAARALARLARAAVVTRGAEGAMGAEGGEMTSVSAMEIDAVDATGAGDLFAAAYVWADLGGLALPDRLCWANLYAGLSVRSSTPREGAVRLAELLREGRARGYPQPEPR